MVLLLHPAKSKASDNMPWILLDKEKHKKKDPLSETRNLRGLKDNTISFDRWEWGESLFDCSWSEHNQDFSIAASGDGSIQMWDLKNPKVNIILEAKTDHLENWVVVHENKLG